MTAVKKANAKAASKTLAPKKSSKSVAAAPKKTAVKAITPAKATSKSNSVSKTAPKMTAVKTTKTDAKKQVVVNKTAKKTADKSVNVQVKVTEKKTMTKATVKKPAAKTVATKAPAIKVAPKLASKPAVIASKVTTRPVMSGDVNKPAASAAARTAPANDTPVDFRAGDYVVYPAHGVGTIEGVETQSIAGMSVTLYAITFEKDRMRLKIPVQKAQSAGLRKLSTGDRLKDALKTLTGKARVKRTMWSRRAQEYEAKINSGDPVQIAEVLRDLRRPKDDTEQSYSERQIYQSALERLAREVAAVERIAEDQATQRLEEVLTKAAA